MLKVKSKAMRLKDLMRDQTYDLNNDKGPAPRGTEEKEEDYKVVHFQRAGGGYRIVKKSIGRE